MWITPNQYTNKIIMLTQFFANNNCLVTHVYQGRIMNVNGFDPTLGTVKDIEISNAVLA